MVVSRSVVRPTGLSAQQLGQHVGRDPGGDDVGVQRVDEGVGLPVVSKQVLARCRRLVAARLQQLGQLVADLLAQLAKLAAEVQAE